MSKQILKFPNGFLWGAAGSPHQTEGGNVNSDWWLWEHGQTRMDALKRDGKNPESYFSGIACDSYNRYDEDFALAQHLNHNATRFGVEWARVEPKQGEYSEAALDHYEKVLQSAKARGLQTFVTLHHFSSPIWFIRLGGFEKKQNVDLFVEYTKKVAERLGQYVDFWITINEPEIYSTHGYFFGKFPPNKKSLWLTYKVLQNLISAHNRSYEQLHSVSNKPVSMCNQLANIESVGFMSRPIRFIAKYLATEYILARIIKKCDFIAVNYYVRKRVGWFGIVKSKYKDDEISDLGWHLYPSGLENILLDLKKYQKPIYITENGLADARDNRREKYIKDHLFFLHKAIEQGVDVRGYLYWSLIDNFEWDEGFGPRFGLIEIDRNDLLRRKVRYSATKFAEICKNNYLEVNTSDVHDI
jgi:beta-glucosidase